MKARSAFPTREQTEQRLRELLQRSRFDFLQPHSMVVIKGRRTGLTWATKHVRKAQGKR